MSDEPSLRKKPIGIFDLPYELRYTIFYYYVFDFFKANDIDPWDHDINQIMAMRRRRFLRYYQMQPDWSLARGRRALTLFQTCRQAADEGTDVLYGKGDFVFTFRMGDTSLGDTGGGRACFEERLPTVAWTDGDAARTDAVLGNAYVPWLRMIGAANRAKLRRLVLSFSHPGGGRDWLRTATTEDRRWGELAFFAKLGYLPDFLDYLDAAGARAIEIVVLQSDARLQQHLSYSQQPVLPARDTARFLRFFRAVADGAHPFLTAALVRMPQLRRVELGIPHDALDGVSARALADFNDELRRRRAAEPEEEPELVASVGAARTARQRMLADYDAAADPLRAEITDKRAELNRLCEALSSLTDDMVTRFRDDDQQTMHQGRAAVLTERLAW